MVGIRILVVGGDQPWAIENHFVKHLKELGCSIRLFPAHNLFYEYYDKNIIHKLLYKLGLSGIYHRINLLFKKVVDEFHPEVIWVFKGMEISPASLLWAKNQKIVLINYNPDNPFIFSSRGSGNRFITDSISLYDIHFTYHFEIKARLEREFNSRVALLPFGFELDEVTEENCRKENEILQLCFLGNPDQKRAQFITSLANENIPIAIFGHDWSNFVNHPNIQTHPAVLGLDFWKVLRKYRVQLNIMREHNENSHNMRTFEIPAIGGIMVAPDNDDHRRYFNDGKEVFLFKNISDCAALVKSILQLPLEEANKIRSAARDRSTMSGYRYADRARIALEEISRCLKRSN